MADNFLMKGKVYGERKHLLRYPLYAEVKYDEIRLHVKAIVHGIAVTGVEFLSYAGKPLHNLSLWRNDFINFMQATGFRHLDMGVLVNKNFNDSYRWTRSSKGIPGEKYDKATGKIHPALNPSMVEFYLFDLPESLLTFEHRIEQRRSLAATLGDFVDAPVNVPIQFEVASEEELDRLFIAVRADGFEGLMVKTPDHVYVSGSAHRSDGWLKMKPEAEADGVITGVNRAYSIEGVPLDRAGSIDVRCEDGSEASPAGIAHELGADMWAHPEKYTGRWVEFKYMERDRQGGYRHPSFTRFREDKA